MFPSGFWPSGFWPVGFWGDVAANPKRESISLLLARSYVPAMMNSPVQVTLIGDA